MSQTSDVDGFKFWASYYDALRLLDTDAERGHFVMALCEYVFEGKEPQLTGMERFGFTLIAEQAAESKRISARAREKGRKGGQRSGESRRAKADEKFSTKFSTNGFSTGNRSSASSTARSVSGSPPPYGGGGCAPARAPRGAHGAAPENLASPPVTLPPVPPIPPEMTSWKENGR